MDWLIIFTLYRSQLNKSVNSLRSVHISYFLQNCKKRQTRRNGFALFEKRYHNQLKRCQNERYRYQRFGVDDLKSLS